MYSSPFRAGLENRGFTTHTLRHTTATSLYTAGADILSIKEILGHFSIKTTEIYTHISQEMLQAAVEKLPMAKFSEKDLFIKDAALSK